MDLTHPCGSSESAGAGACTGSGGRSVVRLGAGIVGWQRLLRTSAGEHQHVGGEQADAGVRGRERGVGWQLPSVLDQPCKQLAGPLGGNLTNRLTTRVGGEAVQGGGQA